MFNKNIREAGFWVLDYLKGECIRNHYKDMVENAGDNVIKQKKINERLNSLIKHATTTTKYYSDYKKIESIKCFPVMDKNTIKENKDKIMSSDYANEAVHYMSTSGSTGTPFTIMQNKNKRHRVLAEIIYFGGLCGYKLGTKKAILRVWNKKKSKVETLMQNVVMIDISKIDDEILEQIRNTLKKDKSIKCILGYATALDAVSRYLLEKGDVPEMFGAEIIISGSENLSEITRVNLKKVFGCDVVSRYSNQENGVLAQELVGVDGFVINNDSYYIEFLKLDSDEEAEIGELARVIVTDLFNYAMPIIRYDTGDLAVLKSDDNYGRVIKRIEGRQANFVYNTSGGLVSPGTISVKMWKFSKVRQYQLIQEDKLNYVLKLNVSKDVYDSEEIIDLFKSFLGANANVKIQLVNRMPLLSSGKFATTVCKYNPSESLTS